MDPYVCVEKHQGKAVVKVRIGDKHLRYPLTKAGCLQAGRDIFTRFNGEVDNWMNSSSVDFPEEAKPGFKWDVRELMSQGFQEEQEKKNAPKYAMYTKLMEFARDKHFGATLSLDELKAFDELKAHIVELTKGK